MRAGSIVAAVLILAISPGCSGEDPDEPLSELCHWFQRCGAASDGLSCGACDDEDPCTEDSCNDGVCRHLPSANTCSCAPSCGGPDGRLVLVQSLHHGQGGLPDPDGLVGIAVSTDEQHLYAASRDGGRIAHFVRHEGAWRFGETVAFPGVETLAVLGAHLVGGTESGSQAFDMDGETGRLTPRPGTGPALVALEAAGGRLVGTDGERLIELTVVDGGLLAVASEVSATLAGARRLAVSADGRHAYVAGFESSALTTWQLDGKAPTLLGTSTGKAGLSQPSDVAISPDGANVYVTGYCDHDIAILARNIETGELTHLGSVYGEKPALGDCVVLPDAGRGPEDITTARLPNPVAVTVSADGAIVAVAAPSTTLDMLFLKREGDTLLAFDYLRTSPPYEGFIGGYVPQKSALKDPSELDWPDAHRYSATLITTATRLHASSLWPDAFVTIAGTTGEPFVQGGAGGLESLVGAYNLEASPDERFLYVAPRYTGTIAPFAIDPDDGGLTPLPIPAVPAGSERSGSITNLDVSRPDGTQLFAVDANHGRLLVFSRDLDSGEATFLDAPALPSCDGAPPFAVDVVSTEDGKSVLVADFQFQGRSCLLNFTRTPEGGLTGPEIHREESLAGIEAIALTQDGAHLYAACHVAGSVAHYGRDSTTGSLTALPPFLHPKLDGAEFIVLSPDDAYVYVASPVTNALTVLKRSPSDGKTSMHQVIDHAPGGPELVWAAGIAVSPSGDQVWVAGRVSKAINLFSRQPDGKLSLEQVTSGVPGLDWVNGLELIGDGRRLYTTAVDDNAVNAWRVAYGAEDGCLGTCP